MPELVCVVDDDESVRDSVPDLLRSFDLQAESFASASDFLASDALHRTGCLILDVAMPGMSGPELQQRLIGQGINVPVVFISAHYNHEKWPDAVRAGAVACLEKPFSETELLNAVDIALGGRPRD